MANKHEARESGTKPAVWARSEHDTTRFYVGSGRPGTNTRGRPGQETKYGGLAWHGPFTSSNPLFCTKPCLPTRLSRFSARFFCAYRTGPARLSPLQTGLRQENEPTGLNDTSRFSNRVWRVERLVWPSLHLSPRWQLQLGCMLMDSCLHDYTCTDRL
jgi:hypothetical protein